MPKGGEGWARVAQASRSGPARLPPSSQPAGASESDSEEDVRPAEGPAWASTLNCPAGETEDRSGGLEPLPRGSEEIWRRRVLAHPDGLSRARFRPGGGVWSFLPLSGSPGTESPRPAPEPGPPASRVIRGPSRPWAS